MTTGAPPTAWRCPLGHSDRGALAAVSAGKPAVSCRFSAARQNPPRRRSMLRRLGDSDTPYRHPTVKYATGAVAPVAPSHSAGSITSRLHGGKVVFPWAGGRPFGGRPPAQGKPQNTRRGLPTAVRYFGGSRRARGDRVRRESE
ncbi:hypothetical protein NDU88_002963 [Pleurodeles waltl]|uniref:Uncharacterized protein n=1 Tax=Pleurodeles waltl TaxID=8319 RepID=A0AAV7TN49_PLEWA|nr:hypothetical protein NDU88_002963 [Pleurodeles waltl]